MKEVKIQSDEIQTLIAKFMEKRNERFSLYFMQEGIREQNVRTSHHIDAAWIL